MDSDTLIKVLGIVGAAKLFEPTTNAIGEKIKTSLGNIAAKAKAKLKGAELGENVEPNYRVLNSISKEAAFCEDEFMAEYFGGVLASSLSEVSRDDRGVSFASLVGRLSTYQIRAHYIFYSAIKSLFGGQIGINMLVPKHRKSLEVFIQNDLLNAAMEFSEEENPQVILPSVMSGLAKENLIEREFEVVGGEKTAYCGGEGVVFCPTDLGVELFLWAHGMGNVSVEDFLKPECEFSFDTKIPIPTGKSVAVFTNQAKKRMELLKPTF
jgi:hypothetical protein